MELQEMLDIVECGWQFVPSNYPATEHMSEQHVRVFALTHILKHQNRTIKILEQIQSSRLPATLEVLTDRICKLLVNSIRFLQFTDQNLALADFNAYLRNWDPKSKGEVSISFNVIKTARGFKNEIESLKKLFDRALDLTEEADHGNFGDLISMYDPAWDFLALSILIASRFGLSREEFEHWLTNDYFKVQLHG